MAASPLAASRGPAWTPETQGLWPSASHELLLEAALARGPSAVAAWRSWREGSGFARYDAIDWHTCRLLPAVYRNLAPQGVDDPWFGPMRDLCRHMWARDLVRRRTLRQALGILGSAGVPVLVLKGEALLSGGYVPRDGRRTMIDSDVLVAPGDIPRAAAALEAQGWRPKHAVIEVTSKSHAWTWASPDGFELDVHRRLLPVPFQPLCFDVLAGHATLGDLEGLPVRVPHATELLLTACVNGRTYVEPGPVPSLWVADVVALTRQRRSPIDWARLLQVARAARLVLPLRDALGYARERFGAEVPEDWLARARAQPLEGSDVRPFLAWSGRQGLASPLRLWLDARDRYLSTAHSGGEAPSLRGLLGFVARRMAQRGPRWVGRACRRLLEEGPAAFQGRVALAPPLRRRAVDPGSTWGVPRSPAR